MNNVTSTIQTSIKAIIDSMKSARNEVADIDKRYFDSGVSTLVSALATNGTAATVSSKLTKGEFVGGITLCEALMNFFGNSAVSQADYLSSAHGLVNGNDAAGAPLSSDTEELGTRLKDLGSNCVELFKQSKDVLSMYTGNQLDAVVANIATTSAVFGADMTVGELSAAITLVEQFKKMMNNEVVTTGDYASTLMKWSRLS